MPLLWYQEGRKRESEDRLDERVWTDLDGGGARGAYQIGAWKALVEAGVKVNAVAEPRLAH